MRHRLPVIVLAASILTGCAADRPLNVVLFTFDTTRADFIGCYGKESASTPALDRLAAQGFLFENAASSHPVTQAAHATILTGTWPMAHGVRDNLLFRLPEERLTLAEILKAHGWATGAAVGGFPLVRSFGSDQGFDFYDDELTTARLDHRGQPVRRETRTWYDERPAGHVNDALLPWIREAVAEERPFFAWLHYWDPHEPHIAPAPFDQIYAHDPYQGEIAYADRCLGTVIEALEKVRELQRTVIIMAADHGEGRMDHDEATHAFLAYGTTVHVPLIIRVPGRSETAGRHISERVGTIDIVPTVLDLVGLPIPEDIQGRSLAPLMSDAAPADEAHPAYYAESLSPRLSHGVGELRVLYSGPYKYIHGPRPELFHLGNDPREIHDLSAERPEIRARLQQELQAFVGRHANPEAAAAVYEVDDETRLKLEALGYLSTTGDESAAVTEILTMDGAAPQDRVGDINLMSRLRQEFGAGRFHLAKLTARRLLELDPENAYYQGRLAATHLGLGQITEAAEVVDVAPVVNSANMGDFLAVAKALFATDEEARGLAMAERVISASSSAQGLVIVAAMRRDVGDVVACRARLDQALEIEPGHREARLEMAHLLEDIGDVAEAEALYRQLGIDFPVDVESRIALSGLLRRSDRADQALASIERVLRLAPGRCEAHLEYLRLLVDLDRADEADGASRRLREVCRDGESRSEADDLMAGLRAEVFGITS